MKLKNEIKMRELVKELERELNTPTDNIWEVLKEMKNIMGVK